MGPKAAIDLRDIDAVTLADHETCEIHVTQNGQTSKLRAEAVDIAEQWIQCIVDAAEAQGTRELQRQGDGVRTIFATTLNKYVWMIAGAWKRPI